jgi:hypothetical protein
VRARSIHGVRNAWSAGSRRNPISADPASAAPLQARGEVHRSAGGGEAGRGVEEHDHRAARAVGIRHPHALAQPPARRGEVAQHHVGDREIDRPDAAHARVVARRLSAMPSS